jgi:Outer membrane protein beta-barrel domain
MSRPQVLKLLLLAGPLCLMPLQGQDYSKFTMNIGGGITTPLNPTGAYAGVSGNFVLGGGYNINKSNAIIADFMWAGLPSNLFVLQPVKAPESTINLYSLTVNYRRQFDRIKGSAFGVYFVGGGGWYHRYATLQKDYVVPPATPCLPYWSWWGYSCVNGAVYSETVAKKGVNTGGFNGGVGFTIRLADSNIRFFTEARYHYAFHERIPSTMVPVTFGFRYN